MHSLLRPVCLAYRSVAKRILFWKKIVTDMADDPLWGIQSETLSARLVAHYPHTHITHVTFMRITCSGLRHAGPIIRYLATDRIWGTRSLRKIRHQKNRKEWHERRQKCGKVMNIGMMLVT